MKFDGSFEENCMETSVPQSLIELVSMIEHSPDIETQIETETTKSDLAISQTFTIQLSSESEEKENYVAKTL